MNKDKKINKLFKWEGKKEIFWILFFLLLFFLTYAYFRDTKACNEVLKSDCYLECKFYETINGYQAGGITPTDCNYETNTCYFAGIQKNINDLDEIIEVNISS